MKNLPLLKNKKIGDTIDISSVELDNDMVHDIKHCIIKGYIEETKPQIYTIIKLPMKILRPKPVLQYPLTDKQTVFDYVYHHFIVENNPHAIIKNDNNPVCVYDTPTGGCAVGCLLPAELRAKIGNKMFGIHALRKYRDQSDESQIGYEDFLIHAEEISKVFPDSNMSSLLEELQKAHDYSGLNCADESRRKDRMKKYLFAAACNHNLTIPAE